MKLMALPRDLRASQLASVDFAFCGLKVHINASISTNPSHFMLIRQKSMQLLVMVVFEASLTIYVSIYFLEISRSPFA
jgi:hypothetical protein